MRKRKLKAPELMRARNALIKFLKDNDLDPAKDYSKHPKYGEEYRKLMITLQIERDKVMVDYPNQDIKNRKKYYKMKKDKKKQKAAKAAATAEAPAKVTKKAAKASNEEKAEKKAKKATASHAGKYDYPLIDGREMTSAEKKKYRAEQRKAASGDAPKEKKEKKAKKADAPEEAPKEKKSKKEKKTPKVGKKDKKKAKKVED